MKNVPFFTFFLKLLFVFQTPPPNPPDESGGVGGGIFVYLKKCKVISAFFLIILISPFYPNAQSCETMNIQEVADIPSICSELTMTMLHDQMERPFLYVANKAAGLKIYDISLFDSPVFLAAIPTSEMEGLHVMNLHQDGEYLYLALGDSFGNTQAAGMAIVDVFAPANAAILDVWKNDAFDSGTGIVKTEGNVAYLGAMLDGLVLLDISDKNNILFIQQFVPEIDFPDPSPDPTKFNARGMSVKDDLVYLCHGGGGLRIIDVSDKTNPIEIGRYSNPELNNLPRAYNNLILDEPYVYVAVDYCGLEVLDISDPNNISLTGWWNPWDCQGSPLNWFSSPGHTNEISYDADCKKLFLSSGKSDLHVVDISNPAEPDSCNYFGGIDNNIGTWGTTVYDGKIFLSYVCAFIPFTSNWTGVKILTYDNNCVNAVAENTDGQIKLYPNPASDILNIELNNKSDFEINIYDLMGRSVYFEKIPKNKTVKSINISGLEDGVYYLTLNKNGKVSGKKIVKIK